MRFTVYTFKGSFDELHLIAVCILLQWTKMVTKGLMELNCELNSNIT